MKKTIEQKVYEVLENEAYTLSVAGENIKFKYASLSDLEKMSAYASVLPSINPETQDIGEIFESFKYVGILYEIISITLSVDVHIDRSKLNRKFLKSKETVYNETYNKVYQEELDKILDIIKRKAKIVEIWALVKSILKENHVFFYLDIIDSLKGTNVLKPTKETNQTAHG